MSYAESYRVTKPSNAVKWYNDVYDISPVASWTYAQPGYISVTSSTINSNARYLTLVFDTKQSLDTYKENIKVQFPEYIQYNIDNDIVFTIMP